MTKMFTLKNGYIPLTKCGLLESNIRCFYSTTCMCIYCSYTISWLKETVRWILTLHQIREHGV